VAHPSAAARQLTEQGLRIESQWLDMHLRGFAVKLLPLLLCCLSSHAQMQPFSGYPGRMHAPLCSLIGRVATADGQPAAGIRIEVRDATSAVTLDTSTRQDGSFEVNNLTEGNYEVLAQAEHSSVRAYVTIQFGLSSIDLRLPANAAQSRRPTVSVAAMMVPAKARDAYDKARQRFASGKLDQSQRFLDRALQLYPGFSEALTLRGMVETKNGQFQAAQRDLEQAIQEDASYGPAYTVLGAVYNSEGLYDEALHTLDHGAEVSPGVWQTYVELTRASIGKGQYQEGLRFAARAEQLNGNSFAPLHLLKAYAMVPLKLYQEARRELQMYLEQEPKGPGAEQAQLLLVRLQAAEAMSLPPTR
jgi:tetratricopeptide (TPR) repeat protein